METPAHVGAGAVEMAKKAQKLRLGRILATTVLATFVMLALLMVSVFLFMECFETTVYRGVDIAVAITLTVAGILIGSFNRVREVLAAAILCTTFVTLGSFIISDTSVVSWRFFSNLLLNITVVAFVGTITRVVLGKRGLKW